MQLLMALFPFRPKLKTTTEDTTADMKCRCFWNLPNTQHFFFCAPIQMF